MATIESSILEYYNETQFDYNVIWRTRQNLSIHFGFYDEHANHHNEAVLNTNRYMADAVGIQKGQKVLDAGCGVGGAAFWLVAHREVEVTGITPVAHQVYTCRAKSKELGLEHSTSFLEADYLAMPFPEASFDIVWACESVCHSTRKEDFYREAFRVLKPGGKLVMAEYMRYCRPLPNSDEKKMLSGFLGWAIKDIDSGKEHFQHATQTGFGKVDILDCSAYVRVSIRNVWRHCKRWLWLERLLRKTGIRSRVQHGNLLGTIDICETFLNGNWYYGILTAQKGQ